MGLRMEAAGLGERTGYELPITQTQLADALGITSVHVNRTLQALRRDRIVRTEQRRIYIDDWGRLSDLAEFDPEFLLIEPLREAA
jgi:CRP-like cAMP-binding protein